jgi:hypothetical protein
MATPAQAQSLSEWDEEKKDVKSLIRAHPALSRGIRANRPIRAWLAYYSATSGGANTAFASGYGITPNSDSSWASWQATFDEFRVVEAEAIWNTFYTVDPTAMPANSSNTIIVYDPTASVTLASVNAGLQFEHYALSRNQIPTTSGPKVSPQCFTKDGFHHFKVKIPQGTQLSTAQTGNSTGIWRPTGDAATYDWGNFALYTSVGGTTSVLRTEVFVRMLVEFRVRR